MTTLAANGVFDVSCAVPLLMVGLADCEVYGIMILIGTVIGCIAGIPGVNGYAGKLAQFDLDRSELTH